MPVKVLLADDHRLLREGLRSLLESEDGIDVVGEAANGKEALQFSRQCLPDVVLMDIAMPEMNGIEATRLLTSELPTVRVLALSMESDRRFVVEVLKAGACGYLLKDCPAEELIKAIRIIASGETYLASRITQVVIKDFLQRIPDEMAAGTLSTISTREREVLKLIASGKSAKEIAFDSNVSIKTIETQRQMIMKKLNLFSIAELTKYAVREGLTSLN